jgi:hypothetical protein
MKEYHAIIRRQSKVMRATLDFFCGAFIEASRQRV